MKSNRKNRHQLCVLPSAMAQHPTRRPARLYTPLAVHSLFYGSNKSWNVTDQRIFFSSSMLSFLMKTEAWSRKVTYLRTFRCQKDREGMKFSSSWLLEPNFKHVNKHFSNRHICVHVIILDYQYLNMYVILGFWDQKANLVTVSKIESWLSYYIVWVLVQRHTSMKLYSLHFSFPIDKLKKIIVLGKFGKRWTRQSSFRA